ncbi:unnamed protein product [Soboliphyme baturini]|uniref:limulus clotting factor C n=1 Tax=Soboliphyme baturini TaxID=241478 RepID=A0A183IL49_9BILA|nr:unnamed protein product [Soboliphyme baturini]
MDAGTRPSKPTPGFSKPCRSSSDCQTDGAECVKSHCACGSAYYLVTLSNNNKLCMKSADMDACLGRKKPAAVAAAKPITVRSGTCGTSAVVPSVSLRTISSGAKFRIVGGKNALNCSYPYATIVQRKQGNTVGLCGGSLISSRHVLTAAHCWQPGDLASYFQMTFGTIDKSDQSAQKILGGSLEVHENYVKAGKGFDIMIIKLAKDVTFNACTMPICLPTTDVPADTMCVAVGWGIMAYGSKSTSTMLQEVGLPLMNTSTCFDSNHYNSLRPPNVHCAGFETGGKDTCQGDSGGPLACRHDDGKFYLHGITSFGGECGQAKFPGVYTKVTAYIDWIVKHMK